MLPTSALADESTRKRFRKQVLSLSRLNHYNVAAVYDFDTQGGVHFNVGSADTGRGFPNAGIRDDLAS